MLLKKRIQWNSREYICELTEQLDNLFGYKGRYCHYIIDYGSGWYAVRVPGKTVGEFKVDEYMKIETLVFNYEAEITKELRKYFGVKIEFNEEN